MTTFGPLQYGNLTTRVLFQMGEGYVVSTCHTEGGGLPVVGGGGQSEDS